MDLIQAIKIIEEEMIRYNYSHETPCRLRGSPTGNPLEIWLRFEYLSRSDNYIIEDFLSITAKSLILSFIEVSKSLLRTKKKRWKTPSPIGPKFQINEPKNMNEKILMEALDIIEEELIESGTRCHYTYNLEIKTIEIPPYSIPGFSAEISSEVFGEINTAMEESLFLSIINLSKFLLTTRNERWDNE